MLGEQTKGQILLSPKGEIKSYSPVLLMWLDWLDLDWNLSNFRKQSLCWLPSQNTCFSWHLLICCHSRDWWLLNPEFCFWCEGFPHNFDQHILNMYLFLPHTHGLEMPGHHTGHKSFEKYFYQVSLWDPQGCCKWSFIFFVLHWPTWAFPSEGAKGH
jgi:hypothetical protein